jgi:N-acetylmuramoyl-L-alanine amidase
MRRALTLLTLAGTLLGATRVPADAPPGNVIRVKGVAGDTVLALLPSEAGGLVRLDVMARLLGGALDSASAGRWRLRLGQTALEFQVGSSFVSYNGFTLPMIEDVRLADGAPHVPLQLFSEIIPRFSIGILWDRSRWEVRLFQGLARRAEPILRAGEPTATPVSTVANAAPGPVAPMAGGGAAPSVVTAVATGAAVPARATISTASSGGPAAAPAVAPSRAVGSSGLSRRYTVAVDAGHGGVDPGNPGVVINGRRLNEARLTLQMALKLEAELERRGIGVVQTRRRDTLIALHERGPIANARQADLFLSLHTNAANPNWRNGSAVRGVETYFLSTARTEDERRVASMENDVVRFETETETEKGDPLSFILNDMAQNEHLRESSDLAQLVQGRLRAVHPGPNRGVKQAGFSVLMRAYMPAILVEVGFGTNLADARWMASDEGQRDIAVSIADAVLEYLQHYERRTRSAVRP